MSMSSLTMVSKEEKGLSKEELPDYVERRHDPDLA